MRFFYRTYHIHKQGNGKLRHGLTLNRLFYFGDVSTNCICSLDIHVIEPQAIARHKLDLWVEIKELSIKLRGT